MACLTIVKYPDRVLLGKSQAIKSAASVSAKTVRDMIDTMYHEDGVGLAAPQVGIAKQIIIVSPEATPGKEQVYFNPKILQYSGGEEVSTEGCLSLPGIAGEVRRARKVKFEALNEKGERVTGELRGFPARVLQHEVDHLNGMLIIDRLDFDRRQEALRKYLNK